MQTIINGIVYNTNTAAELALRHATSVTSGYYHEALYRTEQDAFFLYRIENHDTNIIPLTYEEAKSWAEAHFPEKPYQTILENPEETVPFYLHLKKSDIDHLKQSAKTSGISVEAYILSLIE